MRHGRIIPPKDLPVRTTRLLEALASRGIVPETPVAESAEARLAVHTEGFLQYLETAWDRWSELPDRGPEVWPNTSVLERPPRGPGAAPVPGGEHRRAHRLVPGRSLGLAGATHLDLDSPLERHRGGGGGCRARR